MTLLYFYLSRISIFKLLYCYVYKVFLPPLPSVSPQISLCIFDLKLIVEVSHESTHAQQPGLLTILIGRIHASCGLVCFPGHGQTCICQTSTWKIRHVSISGTNHLKFDHHRTTVSRLEPTTRDYEGVIHQQSNKGQFLLDISRKKAAAC